MEQNRHIGEHIIDHFLGGEENLIEDPVLDKWLSDDDLNRLAFEQYKKIWREISNAAEMEKFDTNLAWTKINEINQQKETFRKRLKNIGYVVSGIAASIVFFVLLSHIGVFEKSSPNAAINVTTNYGSHSEIVLPDGTDVKLNAGSKLSYVYNSQKKIREVNFNGEAFFNVAKNKTPFVINTTDGLQVKVLGTTFNLSAYAEDKTICASLVEGCIEMTASDEKLTLVPGQIGVYDKTDKGLKTTDGILSHTYGWMNSKLYMNNMSLSEVCRNLERWYDLDISLQSELGESIHYTGVLKEESFIDVLDALCRLSKIKYQVKGKKISITSK